MNLHIRRLTTIAGVVAIIIVGTDVVHAQSAGPRERFTAIATNVGPHGRIQTSHLEITVSRWLTDHDIAMLIGALASERTDALFDELDELGPVGSLRMPDGTAYDLLFAQKVTGEGGMRHVILLTDFITFSGAAFDRGPIVYGFALIELRLDRRGAGEGDMSITTMITPRGEHAVIGTDEYAMRSVRLLDVRSTTLPRF
jgi:hypothetical protein